MRLNRLVFYFFWVLMIAAACSSWRFSGGSLGLDQDLSQRDPGLQERFRVNEVPLDPAGVSGPVVSNELSNIRKQSTQEGQSQGPLSAAKPKLKSKQKTPRSSRNVLRPAEPAVSSELIKPVDALVSFPLGPYPKVERDREIAQTGEFLQYEATWLGVVAGHLSIEWKPIKQILGRRVYHIHGHMWSSDVFSLVYRLNDTCDSYMDVEGLFSHRFQYVQDESKKYVEAIELSDYEKGQAFSVLKIAPKNEEIRTKENITSLVAYAQDGLSVIYRSRLLKFEQGNPIVLPFMSNAEAWDLELLPGEIEDLQLPVGQRRGRKIQVKTKFNGVLKQKGEVFVWLSDDSQQKLLMLQGELKIGSIKLRLEEDKLQ